MVSSIQYLSTEKNEGGYCEPDFAVVCVLTVQSLLFLIQEQAGYWIWLHCNNLVKPGVGNYFFPDNDFDFLSLFPMSKSFNTYLICSRTTSLCIYMCVCWSILKQNFALSYCSFGNHPSVFSTHPGLQTRLPWSCHCEIPNLSKYTSTLKDACWISVLFKTYISSAGCCGL